MNAQRFMTLLQELIDENPLAVRATLRILQTEFTDKVPTLAVTCESQPRLLVNLAFIGKHCQTDAHVKAVLCHEFLHVLLRHTEDKRPLTRARHIATDAVINAIIHRSQGESYSSMMSLYYADQKGVERLLRRPDAQEVSPHNQPSLNPPGDSRLRSIWRGLYQGSFVVDDIEAVAKDLCTLPTEFRVALGQSVGSGATSGNCTGDKRILIGNHLEGPDSEATWSSDAELPQVLQDALNQTLREMNGHGVWRSPHSRGVGANSYETLVRASDTPLAKWRRETMQVLRRHVMPDRHARKREDARSEHLLPVLSPSDRRAFVRALWLPYLPQARWDGYQRTISGTTQVYLDVSGSMNHEMPHLVALLAQLGMHIRKPLWAFSNTVAPATIRNGQLLSSTSGGTSMTCVLEHLTKTRPSAAVVVTDGFIESIPAALLRRTSATRLHVLLSRDGSASKLERAGIAYTQLGRVPK